MLADVAGSDFMKGFENFALAFYAAAAMVTAALIWFGVSFVRWQLAVRRRLAGRKHRPHAPRNDE